MLDGLTIAVLWALARGGTRVFDRTVDDLDERYRPHVVALLKNIWGSTGDAKVAAQTELETYITENNLSEGIVSSIKASLGESIEAEAKAHPRSAAQRRVRTIGRYVNLLERASQQMRVDILLAGSPLGSSSITYYPLGSSDQGPYEPAINGVILELPQRVVRSSIFTTVGSTGSGVHFIPIDNGRADDLFQKYKDRLEHHVQVSNAAATFGDSFLLSNGISTRQSEVKRADGRNMLVQGGFVSDHSVAYGDWGPGMAKGLVGIVELSTILMADPSGDDPGEMHGSIDKVWRSLFPDNVV